MSTHKNSNVLLVIGLIFVLAHVVPVAGAAEGRSDDADTTKNFGGASPLLVPAAAFSPNGNNAESTNFVWSAGLLKGTASSGGCVQAPVYLPRWARVTEVWASFVDADGSNNASVWLTRTSNWDPSDSTDMATVTTTLSDTAVRSFKDLTIDEPVVLLPDYSYSLSTCLASENLKLYSVRIWYREDTIFVDGFERGDLSGWSAVSQ